VPPALFHGTGECTVKLSAAVEPFALRAVLLKVSSSSPGEVESAATGGAALGVAEGDDDAATDERLAVGCGRAVVGVLECAPG